MRWLRRLPWIVLFVAVLLAGWWFPAHNAALVSLDYGLGVTGEVPLWLALLLAFGLGAAAAGLVGTYQATRLSLVSRRYRRTARDLEAEVHQLRNLPLSAVEADPAGPDAGASAQGGAERALERGS